MDLVVAQFWCGWRRHSKRRSLSQSTYALQMSQEGNIFSPLHRGKRSKKSFAGELKITSNG